MLINHKKNAYLFLIILIVFLSIFFIFKYNNELINFFLISENKNFLYYFYLFVFNFIYFLTPLPLTPAILLNGFILQYVGFFMSYSILIIDSIIIFQISKKYSSFFQKKFFSNKYLNKYIKILEFSKDHRFMMLSRYIIPPFMHNIYYSLANTKLNIFTYVIILSEIPQILAWNLFGLSLKNFIMDDVSLKDVLLNINFILPLLIVILILIFSKKVLKKMY